MVGQSLGSALRAFRGPVSCVECARGFHEECKRCRKGKCHSVATKDSEIEVLQGRGRPLLRPEDFKDAESSGRKRAAQLWPIFKEEPCEWRGKKNCGGGLKPIIGCINGTQKHRHHGPIKNTLHNEPGNVHRICYFCHVRWHVMNDPEYDENVYRNLPHKPEGAGPAELAFNEQWWKSKKDIKVGSED